MIKIIAHEQNWKQHLQFPMSTSTVALIDLFNTFNLFFEQICQLNLELSGESVFTVPVAMLLVCSGDSDVARLRLVK